MKKRMIMFSLLLFSTGLVLAACATAPEAGPDTSEKTIYVAPERVDCVGSAPQQCLRVKEDPDAEYSLFYDQIEGFQFEEGYEYELLISEEHIENPPADGSSINWTLVEEVSKTPVEVTAEEALAPSEEAALPAEGEELTVYIGPELVDCVGVAPQTCLQVKTNPEHDYTLFYDHIEGFEFEAGYEYELRVLVEPVENAPADASTLQYSLIEEVSKTPASEESAAEAEETVPEGNNLEQSTWAMLSLVAPDGQTFDLLPDTRITVEFSDGQIAGTAGCNNYFGSYEMDGSSITILPIGSTMMICPPESVMIQETAYLATLSTVTSYEIVDDQLHLKNASGETVLLFDVEEALSMTEGSWNLISYNNGNQAMVSVIAGTEITANFGDDGQVTGSAGCNSYNAAYEIDDSSISIGLAASTQKFCMEPEGVMEQEIQYLSALQNAAIYSINGTRLEIRDAGGSGVATFEAAQPTTLSGKTWNLLFHNNGRGGMVSTINGTQITANFDEEGNLGGSAGCNNYTSTYEANGEQLTIGPAATTRMFCAEPEDIMEQEAQYLAAIESAAVYMIEGSRLEIRDAAGAGIASYEVLQEDAASSPGAETNDDAEVVEATIPETPETTDANGESSSESGVPIGIADAVANASYPLDYTGNGTVQLIDGELRQPAAEGSAEEIVVQITEHAAIGELSNGQQAVAVILASQTGGTGTFYDLVVMNEQDGSLTNPMVTYLGDRIVVNDLAIENGQIVVDIIVQGPNDPFCCPTQNVVQAYDVANGALVQVSSEVIGTVESQEEAVIPITGIVWKWEQFITPLEEITIDNPQNYSVEFQKDGLLNVTADCNVGSGTYELSGNSIDINITATTLALCAEGSYGDRFFSSLDNAAIYFMDGEDLMMDLVADGGTMRLIP